MCIFRMSLGLFCVITSYSIYASDAEDVVRVHVKKEISKKQSTLVFAEVYVHGGTTMGDIARSISSDYKNRDVLLKYGNIRYNHTSNELLEDIYFCGEKDAILKAKVFLPLKD